MSDDQPSRGLRRVLPIAEWLPRYDRSWLRGDLLAGIAVTALVVPKNLGYAGIAGVPAGEWAVRGGGRRDPLRALLHLPPDLNRAELVACRGRRRRRTGDEARAVRTQPSWSRRSRSPRAACSCSLALFRLGWIARFLSKAVITGFLAGAAVDVTVGELPKLTGTSSSGDSAWRELWTWIQGLGDIHWTTLVVGLASLGVILGLRFTAPAVPGALVLVVGGLLASGLFDLGAHGVALVGHVPRGLPSPALPDWTSSGPICRRSASPRSRCC